MRLSRYFLPTLRETPKEAEIVSHRLMLRAGLIRQQAAGIYSWLPLGKRVLANIEQIVREEQNRAGAIEILMPTIQPADLWRESGRYDDYGKEMLRIKDRHERDMLYGPTNEEMVTDIFRAYVSSYRALPLNLYHIQWKFRDEVRPRFGVMRGREFLMKDAYSFDIDEAAARVSYNRMFVAYLRTFARMGLTAIPMRAETGPIGGDLSHEFLVLAETGESGVFCTRDLSSTPVPGEDVDYDGDLTPLIAPWTAHYAATEDVHDAARFEREVPEDKRLAHPRHRGRPDLLFRHQVFRADEGAGGRPRRRRASRPWRLLRRRRVAAGRRDHRGQPRRGRHHLAGQRRALRGRPDQPQAGRRGRPTLPPRRSTSALRMPEFDVLYDDLDERAGAKFATMDLIGLPWQVIVGPKGIAAGEVEVKRRATGERETLTLDGAVNRLVAGCEWLIRRRQRKAPAGSAASRPAPGRLRASSGCSPGATSAPAAARPSSRSSPASRSSASCSASRR